MCSFRHIPSRGQCSLALLTEQCPLPVSVRSSFGPTSMQGARNTNLRTHPNGMESSLARSDEGKTPDTVAERREEPPIPLMIATGTIHALPYRLRGMTALLLLSD